MQKNNRSKMLLVIGGIWLALMLLNSLSSNAGMKTVPYSEFLRLAKEGKVSEVAVTDNVIQGVMLTENSDSGQGVRFQTVRVDPAVSDLLDQNGIEYTGKIQSNLLANLFSWIFPVLLFLGIWYFIMRRFQQQQGGFMALGKNKAKIYMENDVQVKFEDAAGVDEAKQELVEVIDFWWWSSLTVGFFIPKFQQLGHAPDMVRKICCHERGGRPAIAFSQRFVRPAKMIVPKR